MIYVCFKKTQYIYITTTRNSGASALEYTHVLPIGDLEFRRVVLIEIENLKLGQFTGCTAGSRCLFSILLPDETLEQCVMVSWIVTRWTSTLAVTCVEAFRLDYEVETLEILEGDAHVVSTTFLGFAVTLGTTATMEGHQLLLLTG